MLLALFALLLSGTTAVQPSPAVRGALGIGEPAAGGEPMAAAASVPVHRRRVVLSVAVESAAKVASLSGLADEVRDIWRPYADVDLVDDARVDATGYDDRLSLVIVDRPRVGAANAMALGWIYFVGPGRPDRTITVSTAVAATLMQSSLWGGFRMSELPRRAKEIFERRALGRAIAHEVGHYLLRSSAHAASGLMRETLNGAEIMERYPSQLRLRREEIDLLRRSPAIMASWPPASADVAQ